MLRPLLGNLRLLEMPHLAVKLFLPAEQQPALEAIARVDRLDAFTLSWDSAAKSGHTQSLRELLRSRVRFFHALGSYSLSEMCTRELRHSIEDALLEEGGDSPRNLLRLGNQLFNVSSG